MADLMAEDHWEDLILPASFGGVPLDVLEISADRGRVLDISETPHRDGATSIQDLGGKTRIDRLRLIFCRLKGELRNEYWDRYKRVVGYKDQGEPQVFVHPLQGQYLARIMDWQESASAEPRSCVMVDCTLVEEVFGSQVYEPGAGAPPLAGLADVQQACNLMASYEPATADLAGEIKDTVTGWTSEGQVFARDLNLSLAKLQRKLDDAIDQYELATDIKRWPTYRAIQNVRATVTRAAIVVRSTTPRQITFTTAAPLPLRLIAVKLYGAKQAQVRYEELLRLNKVRNPMRVPAGTVLHAQAPTVDRQATSRAVA